MSQTIVRVHNVWPVWSTHTGFAHSRFNSVVPFVVPNTHARLETHVDESFGRSQRSKMMLQMVKTAWTESTFDQRDDFCLETRKQ